MTYKRFQEFALGRVLVEVTVKRKTYLGLADARVYYNDIFVIWLEPSPDGCYGDWVPCNRCREITEIPSPVRYSYYEDTQTTNGKQNICADNPYYKRVYRALRA